MLFSKDDGMGFRKVDPSKRKDKYQLSPIES